MDLKHSIRRALLLLALLLPPAHSQDAITKPDQHSLVTKGQEYTIVWGILAPPEVSNVSIALTNPNVELRGGLGVITRYFVAAIGGRDDDSGAFLYHYSWEPDESLETSDTYRIRVVEGNVTLDSQSFFIGSGADVAGKEGGRAGPSAAVVGGAVGGALGAVILLGLAVAGCMLKRRGWGLAKGPSSAGGEEEGEEEGEVKGEGAGGAVYRPAGTPQELEGSLGRYEHFNRQNSELPGSPVLEGVVPDLIQQQEQEDQMFMARRLGMLKF